MEPARQRLLFGLFIPHFIEMSQFALQVEEAIPVAQITIRQAERLARLYYEQDDKGQKYLDQIEPVKQGIELLVRQRRSDGPNVPRRGNLVTRAPSMTRPRSMGSRKSSMIEDPYVNLTKVLSAVIIDEETHDDDDAKSTLKASRGPKRRPTIAAEKLMITAQIHAITSTTSEKQHITAEDIIENAYKRHGLGQSKPASEEVRIRA